MVSHTRPAPQILRWTDLEPPLRERLAAEGLDSPAAWRVAGRRRLEVFGIPTPLARQLDAVAREA